MILDLISQLLVAQTDFAKQTAITNATSVATDARTDNRILQIRVQQLEDNIERLSLTTLAIAEILCDRFGITETEIEAKVREIDLRDGKLDGRLRATPKNCTICTSCAHSNASHRRNCLYCGHALSDSSQPIATSSIEPENNNEAS